VAGRSLKREIGSRDTVNIFLRRVQYAMRTRKRQSSTAGRAVHSRAAILHCQAQLSHGQPSLQMEDGRDNQVAQVWPLGERFDRTALVETKQGIAMHFTIGICAHNEEATIGLLLEEVRLQDYGNNVLDEILVCLDGCTDKTFSIVKEFARIEPRLKVFINPTRRGKAVSLTTLLKNSRGEVFVDIDADVKAPRLLPLLNPFNNTATVAVVPRGVPYSRAGVGPRLYEVMWRLHHLVCQKFPKISSGCNVFRPLVREIPAQVIGFDSYLQVRLQKLGRIVYVPNVYSYTEPPRGLRQFLAQRYRWVMAQVQILKLSKSAPPTYKIENVVPHLAKVFLMHPIVCTLLVLLELIVRTKARVDFRLYGAGRVISYPPLRQDSRRAYYGGDGRRLHESLLAARIFLKP